MQTLRRIQAPVVRILISLALVITVFGPLGHPPPAARAAGPYQVNTAADGHDSGPGDGDCYDGVNGCTLRAAIDQATADGLPTTITFHPDLVGATLVISDTFGTIQWVGGNITVTGGSNLITISGENLSNGLNLFEISGNNNTLSDLTLKDSPAAGVRVGDIGENGRGNDNHLDRLIIIGSGSAGIEVYGGDAGGGRRNHITNSRIGTSDSAALACDANESNGDGVFIRYPAIATDVTGNVIGCNSGSGVYMTGGFGSPLATSLTNNRIGISDTGGDLGNGQAGVRIFSGASDVTIDQNIISGNGEQGIDIGSPPAHAFTITYNMIGTNAAGTLAVPNGMQGILVENVNNALARITDNLISGNAGDGVELENSAGVTLRLNRIGVNQAGDAALANGGNGLALTAGAHDNLIGDDQSGGNLISGNAQNGVMLLGVDTAFNVFSDNYIGTSLDGYGALPNAGRGVWLDNGPHDNTFGSPTEHGARNIISGNGLDGVMLSDGATANRFDGNYIGVNADGAAALPNGARGVLVLLSSGGNILGSPGAEIAQLISGNGQEGIYISSSDGTIIGDLNGIGVSLTPSIQPAGNGAHGIFLFDANGTRILAAYIAYNGGAGVAVTGASAGNKITPVFNGLNSGLPIDLGDDGPTPNDTGDADTGPNGLQNYPAVTALAGAVVSGTACANCRVFVYKAIGNPAAPGGGGTRLGETVANGSGVWSFSGLPAGLNKLDISAVACDSACVVSGNTSEMSPRPALYLPVLFRN